MIECILHDLVQHCALCAVDDRLVGAVFRDDGLRALLRTLHTAENDFSKPTWKSG